MKNKNGKNMEESGGYMMSEQAVHRARKQRTASVMSKRGNLFKSFKPSAEIDKRIIEVQDNQHKYDW